MIIDTTSWLLALAGGLLIGLASAMLLLFNGRIAGISGITGGVLFRSAGDTAWRVMFLLGMLAAGLVMFFVMPTAFPVEFDRSFGALIVAGLMVGFGTRLGSGCTSGHGVCGLSRLSPRSFVATLTFMSAGALMVAFVRHLLGGTV